MILLIMATMRVCPSKYSPNWSKSKTALPRAAGPWPGLAGQKQQKLTVPNPSQAGKLNRTLLVTRATQTDWAPPRRTKYDPSAGESHILGSDPCAGPQSESAVTVGVTVAAPEPNCGQQLN